MFFISAGSPSLSCLRPTYFQFRFCRRQIDAALYDRRTGSRRLAFRPFEERRKQIKWQRQNGPGAKRARCMPMRCLSVLRRASMPAFQPWPRRNQRCFCRTSRLWLKRPAPPVGARDKSLETRTIGRRIESSWRNVSGNGIGPKMEQDPI